MSSTSTPADVLSARGIDDALVRDRAVLAPVQHRIVRLQPLRDVVRVEDRDLRRVRRALRRPSCRCTSSRSAGCSRCPTAPPTPRRLPCLPPVVHDRIARQEVDEMLRHADRPHARAAAAVRDAERLVQVEMADVGADVARTRQADHRVHVRAVHIHLPAVLRARSRRCRGSSPRTRRASTDTSP